MTDKIEEQLWRPIDRWADRYHVSNFGNVISIKRQMWLKPILRPNGMHKRATVTLSRPKQKPEQRFVHHLVLEAFVGPRPPGLVACHNNGNGTDNHVRNLRWDTQASNMQDRLAHGNHYNAVKTHCKYGHEYTEENTYIVVPEGWRKCRTCHRDRERLARRWVSTQD